MELKHHGVEGQHWGVRNGPPYPLNRRKDAAVRTKNFAKNNVSYSKSIGRSREYEKKIAKYKEKGKTDSDKYKNLSNLQKMN